MERGLFNNVADNIGFVFEDDVYSVIERNLLREVNNEWVEEYKSWCKDIRCQKEQERLCRQHICGF